nr:MAG TPA: hypothetical protein [Bacteriophage sp.]
MSLSAFAFPHWARTNRLMARQQDETPWNFRSTLYR